MYENVTETFTECCAFNATLNATGPYNVTNTTETPRYVRDVDVSSAMIRARARRVRRCHVSSTASLAPLAGTTRSR